MLISKELLGTILWKCDRDQNGIIVDVSGNEVYFDISVCDNFYSLNRKDLVSFELNDKIKDCRCGMNVKKA